MVPLGSFSAHFWLFLHLRNLQKQSITFQALFVEKERPLVDPGRRSSVGTRLLAGWLDTLEWAPLRTKRRPALKRLASAQILWNVNQPGWHLVGDHRRGGAALKASGRGGPSSLDQTFSVLRTQKKTSPDGARPYFSGLPTPPWGQGRRPKVP